MAEPHTDLDARPVTALPNLGPAMAGLLGEAGFTSVGALADAGADSAYKRVLALGHRPHFMAYLALVLALQGRPWTDCNKAEKAMLRARFDTLVDESKGPGTPSAGLAKELDRLGVRALSAPKPRG